MVDLFGQKQVLIANPGKGQTLMLYPETKMYMEIPAAAALSPVGENEEALKKIGTRRLIGQENVSGYLCDKYEIAFHNTYRGKMMVWIARKLNYPIRITQVEGPRSGQWTASEQHKGTPDRRLPFRASRRLQEG
jgi:hypothetical protein